MAIPLIRGLMLAERQGFEPWVEVLPLRRFSKPLPSATRPPLHRFTRPLKNPSMDFSTDETILEPSMNFQQAFCLTLPAAISSNGEAVTERD